MRGDSFNASGSVYRGAFVGMSSVKIVKNIEDFVSHNQKVGARSSYNITVSGA